MGQGRDQGHGWSRGVVLLLVPVLTVVAPVFGAATRVSAATPEPSSAGAEDPEPKPDERRFAAGISFGSPQVLGLTGEYAFRPNFRLQANAGSLIIVSTLCARVIVLPESMKLQPYIFAGGGGGYILPLEGEHGFTPFTWWGFGLRLRVGRGRIFGEVGEVGNTDQGNGYQESYPAMAGGILFTL